MMKLNESYFPKEYKRQSVFLKNGKRFYKDDPKDKQEASSGFSSKQDDSVIETRKRWIENSFASENIKYLSSFFEKLGQNRITKGLTERTFESLKYAYTSYTSNRSNSAYSHLKEFVLGFKESLDRMIDDSGKKEIAIEDFKNKAQRTLSDLSKLLDSWTNDTGIDTLLNGFTDSLKEGLGYHERAPGEKRQATLSMKPREPYEDASSPWGRIVRGFKKIHENLMLVMENGEDPGGVQSILYKLPDKITKDFVESISKVVKRPLY